MGSNLVEALIFFQASSFQLLILENLLAIITLHFHLQPQYKYELFHIHCTEDALLQSLLLQYCRCWEVAFKS